MCRARRVALEQRLERLPLDVAQVSNLLYRRFPIGRTWPSPLRSGFGTPAGWKHCDTAGWKPALRSTDRTLLMALLSTSVWRFPQDPIAVGPRINAADALIFTLGAGDGRTLSIRGHFGRAGKDAATHLLEIGFNGIEQRREFSRGEGFAAIL